ncbi:Trk-type K+ transport system, membrane component [Lachnospiraceae bacterium JC7]|nr:Trk-type K+ transport system, membrane component [Lachnospiraceae bacterium JC7]
MNIDILEKKLTSFQIIIIGFLSVIVAGALLLTLPVSSASGHWTSVEEALFTSTSAVCVTGLVVRDTASYWSAFGQFIIMLLIQIGGLGIISVTAFIATVAGRKISLLQRSMLQDSISAHHIGGIVKMTSFIFKVSFLTEAAGALMMLPSFCSRFGTKGIWMAIFHSVSAFCNAGFDLMGNKSGAFSSLTALSDDISIILPISLLIVVGGIGFLTWEDLAVHKLDFKHYRMQSKVILTTTFMLITIPTAIFFFYDFSMLPLKQRLCLSLFQAITPRTAGFNTFDLSLMSSASRALIVVLMLIGGSPGSTAGGMKTTTLGVLCANFMAIVRRKKSPQLFDRRIEDSTVKSAATLMLMYIYLTLFGAFIISVFDNVPIETCIFETASAIGTVGLSLGLTPGLSMFSHMILILLMFFGRVGGLTLLFAAVNSTGMEVARCPIEKINVG